VSFGVDESDGGDAAWTVALPKAAVEASPATGSANPAYKKSRREEFDFIKTSPYQLDYPQIKSTYLRRFDEFTPVRKSGDRVIGRSGEQEPESGDREIGRARTGIG
jgi:hypothetical protein